MWERERVSRLLRTVQEFNRKEKCHNIIQYDQTSFWPMIFLSLLKLWVPSHQFANEYPPKKKRAEDQRNCSQPDTVVWWWCFFFRFFHIVSRWMWPPMHFIASLSQYKNEATTSREVAEGAMQDKRPFCESTISNSCLAFKRRCLHAFKLLKLKNKNIIRFYDVLWVNWQSILISLVWAVPWEHITVDVRLRRLGESHWSQGFGTSISHKGVTVVVRDQSLCHKHPCLLWQHLACIFLVIFMLMVCEFKEDSCQNNEFFFFWGG